MIYLLFSTSCVESRWNRCIKNSRIHNACLNLSSCLNISFSFTKHVIQKSNLIIPLFILFIKWWNCDQWSSPWHFTASLCLFCFLHVFAYFLLYKSSWRTLQLQDQTLNALWIHSILTWSIAMSVFLTFSKIIRGQKQLTFK